MRSGPGVRSATVTVGREAESDILARAVDRARAGEFACTLLVGEGGVGKSRLLHEAIDAARRAGLGVAAGRAAISAPAPFSLIAEALRSWLRGHSMAPMRSAFDHGLKLILPEWEALASEGADLAAGQLRLLALEGTVRVLREVALASHGALLVLDDLHAADPDSLEAVRYVASANVDGLAIAVALRPGESPIADDLLRALRGDGATTVVELEPLGHRAIGDLVAHLLDAAPPDELIADVIARTDGVPLYVEEVVDAHVRARSVVAGAGAAHWRGGPVGLPRSVRGLVAARLERLPPSLRDVLLALAVAGQPDPPGLVSAIADADDAAVSEALRLGVDAGLLTTSAGVIGFRHGIIREAVLDAAIPQVVTAMHRRAAAALPASPRWPGELRTRPLQGMTTRLPGCSPPPRATSLRPTPCSVPRPLPAAASISPARPASGQQPPTRSRRFWSRRGAGQRRSRSTRRPSERAATQQTGAIAWRRRRWRLGTRIARGPRSRAAMTGCRCRGCSRPGSPSSAATPRRRVPRPTRC